MLNRAKKKSKLFTPVKIEEMFLRKLLLIFVVHLLTAYVVGSQIYGFHGDPDKFVMLVAAGMVVVLARYAQENIFASTRDAVLQAFQVAFALSSGGLGYSRDYVVIAMSFLLLFVAVLICYFRINSYMSSDSSTE